MNANDIRSHRSVAIFDDNTNTMLAYFSIYSADHISLKTHQDTVAQVCPEWRFHEWFSFAIRCGHVILVSQYTYATDRRTAVEFQMHQTS